MNDIIISITCARLQQAKSIDIYVFSDLLLLFAAIVFRQIFTYLLVVILLPYCTVLLVQTV